MAAQQLAGAGFELVYNLSGGIRGWNSKKSYGPPDQGLHLFEDLSSARTIFQAAYSLEEGLKDFYLTIIKRISSAEIQALFEKLAGIEDLHMARLRTEYARMTGPEEPGQLNQASHQQVEGGLTTEQYLSRFQPDLKNSEEVIGLALSIEAQALDLYSRAARLAAEGSAKKLLEHLAHEEKLHLEQLGLLLDQLAEQENG